MYYYDIVIIGGGIVGTSVARELAKYRVSVVLLEKEEELAFGVSKSNSGIIHPGTQNHPKSLKGRLCVEGNALTRKIARELGVDFKEVGELIVAFNDEEIEKLKSLKKDAEKLGVPRLQIVDRKWLEAHEPNLSKDVVAALFAPTAGIISPYRWVYDLAENAQANGVKIVTNSKVTRISVNPTAASRFAVECWQGIFMAKYVINAAGLNADDIAKKMGIDDFKIKPRKGEEFLLDKKKEYLTNHLIFPLPTEKSKGTLVIKTSDGNPMIGPTAEDVKDKKDLGTTQEGLEKVLLSTKRLVPSIDQRDIIAYFAGLRPTVGHDFIIRHEDIVPGCITIAGIQSPGLTAAPAIALEVIRLLKECGLSMRKNRHFVRYREKTRHLFQIPFKETKKLIKHNQGYGDIVCRCEMVSAEEIRQAIRRGAKTLDGIKFRTRAGAGRCHGCFCTTRIMKILSEELKIPITKITKRGKGSEVLKGMRGEG